MLYASWYKLYSACFCVVSLEGFNGHAFEQNYCSSVQITLLTTRHRWPLFVRINMARTHTSVQSDPEVGGNDRGGLGIN